MRTVEGVLTEALERVAAHADDRARVRRAHRRRRARMGPGRELPVAADTGVDPARLQSAVNAPARARGRGARGRRSSTPDFDARRSARWRAYRYTIVNRPAPDPFLARYAWWVPEPLDLALLRLGADPFLGEHDFASVLPQGPRGFDDHAARPRIALARPRRRRAALRDPRHRVLLADGALDRRHARRRRDGQEASRRHHGHPPLAEPRRTPASPRHPRACASGRSATRRRRPAGPAVPFRYGEARRALDPELAKYREMYADELAGGALLPRARRARRRASPPRSSSSSPRRRSGTPRTGPSCCAQGGVDRSQDAATARSASGCCARLAGLLRHRGGPPDHAAHRGGRGRPLPRRRRGHRRRWRSRRRPAGAHASRRCRASPPAGASPRSEGRHRAGIGGALRAAVFGVNDGLVSNFSLVMGVAGGTTDNASCCSPASPGSSPARSRWRRASGSRSGRSGSCTRTSCASSSEELAGVPGRGARGARADLPGQGNRPGRSERARRQHHGRGPTSRSTRWPARSSASTPARSAHRGSRRARRSLAFAFGAFAAGHAVLLRQRRDRGRHVARCCLSVGAVRGRCARPRSSPAATPDVPGCAWPLIGALVATVTFLVGKARRRRV